MKACIFLSVFSCFVASTFAVKCFVCTSLSIDKDAKAEYRNAPAYRIRACQNADSKDCSSDAVENTLTISEYYQGQACASFDKKLNTTGSKNIIDCKNGCAKINSNVVDRGVDVSRTTRQCAFYDNEAVGKYMNQAGFKRTGAGSDKVANWFYYCNTDFCNGANGLSHSYTLIIAAFYGLLAFAWH